MKTPIRSVFRAAVFRAAVFRAAPATANLLAGASILSVRFHRGVFFLLMATSPLAALMPSAGWAGPIYVIQQPDGSKRFTNKPPPAGISAKVFTARRGGFSVIRGISGRRARQAVSTYESIITAAADRHGVSVHLIKAVMHVESAFNAAAISRKGAMGLMQLMPETARLMGVKRPFDPTENINGGVRFLASLLARYSADKTRALAAYNAGPGAVDRYDGVPPYAETRSYVRDVLAMEVEYARRAAGKKG